MLCKDFVARIGRELQMIGDPPLGMYFSWALKLFCGSVRNNQPLHYLHYMWNTWPLAIAQRRPFNLGNFWWMRDSCKRERHPSCVTIKDV